jgi:predicted RNase H-like HicB family nuclease
MKHLRQVTAIIEREGDGYVALCPEVDVASQGDTIESARNNLQEAVELFLRLRTRLKSSGAGIPNCL